MLGAATIINDAVMVLSGSGAAQAIQWARTRGHMPITRRREDALASERFMNMALRLEQRLEQQQEEIAELKDKLTQQETRITQQAGLLRESLHLIDELLDPNKPTPSMSPALRAAYENRENL